MTGSIPLFFVTAGSVAVAIAALLWALRVTDAARGVVARWKSQVGSLESDTTRLNSILAAHPGVALIWDDGPGGAEGGEWGAPKTYGSPLALASLLRFSDSSMASDAAIRILHGLSSFEARDAGGRLSRLSAVLTRLRREGAPFSITISTPEGVYIEVDGRTAGSRVVVWIVDTSVKGVEESSAQGRLVVDPSRVIARDPAFFLEFLQEAPFYAWRVSESGRLEWANDIYLKSLDAKSLEQAVARNLLLDPGANDHARRTMDSGAPVTETRPVVIDGKRCAFEITMRPVVGGAAGMAFDVTEREGMRENFAKHAIAQEETLNHLGEGVAVFGPDKRLIFYNKAFADMWRLERDFLSEQPGHAQWLDELKARRMLPMHSNYAEWRAGELAHYQDVSEIPEEPWNLEDGRMLRVARQRHPMGGLLLVFSDITSEQTLRGQFNSMVKVQQAALDRLHEGVGVFGADGRMRLSNPAFMAMWKIAPETISEKPDFDEFAQACLPLFHDATLWKTLKARLTDPGPDARREDRGEIRRSDGTTIIYLTRPLPDGATLVAFLDITASRRVEDALREQAEALQTADRLKTEFMQNVSKQLRDPLQSICGFSEMLANRLAGPLNDRQQDQVNMVVSAAGQLSKLVDNALDLAMVEANEVRLEVSDVPVEDVLREVASAAATNAKDTEIPITVACDPQVGVIRADEKRIRQMLFNLVSNALRFTERGDRITLGAERQDGMIRLWVTDTGRGMSYETQATAFDTFSSGDKQGAGLGLALVRSFAELHEGWVALRSEPGEGTTVSVHLPAERALPMAAE